MDVGIFDEAGKRVYATTVNLNALNYEAKLDEYFNEAWTAAVEDGAVNASDRDKYQVLRMAVLP
jgi:hypothetical protein